MPASRRAMLQLAAGGVLASTAGCLSALRGRPQLSLTALNFTDAFHRLSIELYRTDRGEASEAFVFDAEYELAARGDEVTAVRDADIVPTRPYVVRGSLDGESAAHYHFYPDCTGNGGPEERLYVEVRPPEGEGSSADPRLTYQQNGCSGDAWAI